MTEYRTAHFGYRLTIRLTEMTCQTPQDVMRSPLVLSVVQRFLDHLVKHDSPLLEALGSLTPFPGPDGASAAAIAITDLLRLLIDHRPALIAQMVPRLSTLVATTQPLADFIDRLYDFWRDYERYLIYEATADDSRDRAVEGHVPFVRANDQLKALVLEAYRRIDSHLRGVWPRVYHQVPAGASMGLLVERIPWPCPDGPYTALRDIPFVRLALLELPVVLYPRRNACLRRFTPVPTNPLTGVTLDVNAWFCLPLKVGPLVIHTFFYEEYLGLATSLVNLFELADHADARRAPDGILVFGAPPQHAGATQTVYFEDEEHDVVLGVIERSDAVEYFGYLQKMILTLHNVAMMRRKRLPVHGAMYRLELRNHPAVHIVLVGGHGAGAAETFEALRILAHDELRAMTVIFDEMGSLACTAEGGVAGYGTGTGAFLRLDEMQPGFAFGQIDRCILMNPLKANARLVIPVTTYDAVMAGYPVDFFLAVNNVESVDAEHPILDYPPTPARALSIFNKGVQKATALPGESDLLPTCFANPYGPSACTSSNNALALEYFEALFTAGVHVGQLRTRQGIAGSEQEGPEAAAHALLAAIHARGNSA